MWGFEITVMLVMIAINSVFAAYEIALASTTTARLQRLVDENRGGASVALFMKQNMEASLAVVQLGITLVGALAAAVGGAGAEEMLAPGLQQRLALSEEMAEVLAILLVVLPLTVTTIIFGELIPKVFALRNAEWVCLTLSPAMRWFSLVVWPAVWLFERTVTGIMAWGERRIPHRATDKSETQELQELRTGAALARASRLIGHREEGIILGATRMQNRPVHSIMLPAVHMRTLDAGGSLADTLVTAHLDMHTRFPVVERKDDPQSVIGYVNVKDILPALRPGPHNGSLRNIVRPLLSFQTEQPIAECLEVLLMEHAHIALVRDREGRVVGMITLEDILEELVGEIEDEYDRLPTHVVSTGPNWVAGGGVSLERLRTVTGIELEPPPSAGPNPTLSDWISHHLKREPMGGDRIEVPTVSILVRKIRRHRVQEAQLGPGSKPSRTDASPVRNSPG